MDLPEAWVKPRLQVTYYSNSPGTHPTTRETDLTYVRSGSRVNVREEKNVHTGMPVLIDENACDILERF